MKFDLCNARLSNAWPVMLSGVVSVEIEVVKSYMGVKNFDAITTLRRMYFGCQQGEKFILFPLTTKACGFKRTRI